MRDFLRTSLYSSAILVPKNKQTQFVSYFETDSMQCASETIAIHAIDLNPSEKNASCYVYYDTDHEQYLLLSFIDIHKIQHSEDEKLKKYPVYKVGSQFAFFSALKRCHADTIQPWRNEEERHCMQSFWRRFLSPTQHNYGQPVATVIDNTDYYSEAAGFTDGVWQGSSQATDQITKWLRKLLQPGDARGITNAVLPLIVAVGVAAYCHSRIKNTIKKDPNLKNSNYNAAMWREVRMLAKMELLGIGGWMGGQAISPLIIAVLGISGPHGWAGLLVIGLASGIGSAIGTMLAETHNRWYDPKFRNLDGSLNRLKLAKHVVKLGAFTFLSDAFFAPVGAVIPLLKPVLHAAYKFVQPVISFVVTYVVATIAMSLYHYSLGIKNTPVVNWGKKASNLKANAAGFFANLNQRSKARWSTGSARSLSSASPAQPSS